MPCHQGADRLARRTPVRLLLALLVVAMHEPGCCFAHAAQHPGSAHGVDPSTLPRLPEHMKGQVHGVKWIPGQGPQPAEGGKKLEDMDMWEIKERVDEVFPKAIPEHLMPHIRTVFSISIGVVIARIITWVLFACGWRGRPTGGQQQRPTPPMPESLAVKED